MSVKKTDPAPELDEARILFPEEQVGPYKFRPWSLEQFGELVNTLVAWLLALEQSGIKPADFESRFFELAPTLAKFLPQILGVTLGLAPEEVEAIPVGFRLALGLRILVNRENADQIKNFVTGFLPLGGSPATPKP